MQRGVTCIAVFVSLLLGTAVAHAEPDKEYRVGCAFAITGKASWLGEPQRNTVEMIAEQVNAAGGINGHKLVLYIEDTQGNNTRAVNAAKKLIKKHRVCAVIGPSRSGTSMAMVPILNRSRIPMLSCAAAEAIVKPVAERKWIFKMGHNDSDAVRKIYDHMLAHDIRKIGIISGTTGYGDAGRKQLKAIAREYGIDIVADETYSPADTNMTAQLIRIRNAGAQAIVNWSIVPAQSIVPQNLRQLKMTIPLYQSHGFANVKYLAAAGEAAEGTICPSGRIMAVDTVPDDHPQKSVLQRYKRAYEARFNEHVSTFGGHAYDGIWLVINALEAVGDNPAKIRDFIEKTRFVGVDGIFKFSENDHSGLDKTSFELLTVKDGKFVVLQE